MTTSSLVTHTCAWSWEDHAIGTGHPQIAPAGDDASDAAMPGVLQHPREPSAGHLAGGLGGAGLGLRLAAGSLFSATNLLAMNVAPCGSLMTVIRTQGASKGGTTTLPPSSVTFAAVASSNHPEGHAPMRRRVGLVVRDQVDAGDDVLEALGAADLRHLLAEPGLKLSASGRRSPATSTSPRREGPGWSAEHRAVEGLQRPRCRAC